MVVRNREYIFTKGSRTFYSSFKIQLKCNVIDEAFPNPLSIQVLLAPLSFAYIVFHLNVCLTLLHLSDALSASPS